MHGREQPSKTPQRHYRTMAKSGFAPEFAFNISTETIFLARTALSIRVRKTFCHRAGKVEKALFKKPCGNWESDERDIRDKI